MAGLVMGWASASGIFVEATNAAIKAGVEGEKLTEFAETMIRDLSYNDWDTQDEGAEPFLDMPEVLLAFKNQGYDFTSWAEERHGER